MHYLDNAATTRVLPQAAEEALRVMTEAFGNPSSLHKLGMEASDILESSRKTVAAALSAEAGEVYFTSGGTGSTNIALRGAAHLNRHRKGRIITTMLEHAATKETVKAISVDGFDVYYIKPDRSGHITKEALLEALTEDTVLFSCQLVNNELGTVQPLEELGGIFKERCPGALFHVDAVQGLGKLKITPSKWRCDLMSVSGHKLGAPKGVGAVYIRKGLRLPPLTTGGGQEKNMRPGTEALPNIAAFAKACEIRIRDMDENNAYVKKLADTLRERVKESLGFASFNVESDIPHIQSLSLPGCKSEVMLRVLSDDGVYVSSGSACSKGRQSETLKAIGLCKKESDSTLRISLSPENLYADIEAFITSATKAAKMFIKR